MSDDAPIPLPLTDAQLLAVMQCAEPLPLEERSRFLHRVAVLLRDAEIGDGAASAGRDIPRAPFHRCHRAPGARADGARRVGERRIDRLMLADMGARDGRRWLFTNTQ